MIAKKILLSLLTLTATASIFPSESPRDTELNSVLHLEELGFEPEQSNTIPEIEQLKINDFGINLINALQRKEYIDSVLSTKSQVDKKKCNLCRETCDLCRKAVEKDDQRSLTLKEFEHGTVITFNDFPYPFPHEKNPDGLQLLIYNSEHKKDFADLSLEARGEYIEALQTCKILATTLEFPYIITGINGENEGGASIPEHTHTQLLLLVSEKELKKNYHTNSHKKYNFDRLLAVYKLLYPIVDSFKLSRHVLNPSSLTFEQSGHSKCSKKGCYVCTALADQNDKKHGILRRLSSVAIMLKPFPEIKYSLLVVPLNHREGFNLDFQERSETVELISPLIKIFRNNLNEVNTQGTPLFTVLGYNVDYHVQPSENNKSTHFNVEFVPRYSSKIGFVQKTSKIQLTEFDPEQMYGKLKPLIDSIVIQKHSEN